MNKNKNNFKELERYHETRQPNQFETERIISSKFGFFRHIGNIVDHFLGRAMDVFVSYSGGDSKGPKRPPDQPQEKRNDLPPGRPF